MGMTIDDCINRQAVIDLMMQKWGENFSGDDAMQESIDAIRVMPSVTPQEPILEKIRAEIHEEKECAYADFERYKVEYLGQDWEDALDSLPQDDFRYGMERAIELIDKYKKESEE